MWKILKPCSARAPETASTQINKKFFLIFTEDTTSSTVFFNDVDSSVGSVSAFNEGLFIDGLDGEEIDQSDVDSFSGELFNSLLGFNQGNTSRDDGQLVIIVLEDDLSLTNFELFVILVDDLKYKLSFFGILRVSWVWRF